MTRNSTHTVSVEQAADLLGIGRNSAYAAIHDGVFPVRVIKLGSRYLIPRTEIEELLGINSTATK